MYFVLRTDLFFNQFHGVKVGAFFAITNFSPIFDTMAFAQKGQYAPYLK